MYKLKVIIRLYGQLQNDYNTRELLMEFQEDELTVEEFLDLVNEKYLPGILRRIMRGNYILLHNGTIVRNLQEKLNDGDVIAVLPPAVGGCSE